MSTKRKGVPFGTRPPGDRHPDWIARLVGKVTIRADGCWIVGNPDAYSQMVVNGGKTKSLHRIVYKTLVGDVPKDWDVHHRCETKGCINPDHLEAMSHADHMARHAERSSA